MGTRADFYLKKDDKLNWLGSVAWDGYDVEEADHKNASGSKQNQACWDLKNADTEANFQDALSRYFKERDDVILPENGWPWPWNDSCTTDCAYVFDADKTRCFSWGKEITGKTNENGDRETSEPEFNWPDMSDIANVGTAGFMIFTAE